MTKLQTGQTIHFNTGVDYRSWFDLVDSEMEDNYFLENLQNDDDYKKIICNISEDKMLQIIANVTEFETDMFDLDIDLPSIGLSVSCQPYEPSPEEKTFGGLGTQEVIRYATITKLDREVWEQAMAVALEQLKKDSYSYLKHCIEESIHSGEPDEVKILEYILLSDKDIADKISMETYYAMNENYRYFINYEELEKELEKEMSND